MTSPRRGARPAWRGAALMVVLALTACSQGGLTAAQRLRATTLPTPTKPGVDVHRILGEQLTGIVDARSVTVDEDLVVDGQESESRLGWAGRGTIVDASILPIVSSAPAVEVYRSPTRLLSRPTGNGVACWSEASPALDRFDRSQATERSVLRSARAISGQGTLIKGTVSALALLRIIGTDVELRRRDLLPPAGVAVAATFGIGERGTLQVTTTWSDLVAAAGNSSRHTRQGTWTLQFRATGSDGPTPPSAGQVVSVPRTDPSYAAAVSACNARIH